MKKLLLAAIGIFALGSTASAQLPYTLTVQTGQTYTPLTTGSTSINGSTIWDEQQYTVTMPFTFRMADKTTTTFNLDLSTGGFFTGLTGNVNGFGYDFFTDLADRGNLDSSSSKSPIRYVVSGTSPNRIFKVEIANAGFYNEISQYNTATDSTNIQAWLYETSNVVELRYGPHALVHYSDYFFFDGPLPGYFKNGDLNSGSFDAVYTLAGNPASPQVDSVDVQGMTINSLTAYPSSGTVYRFTPKSVGFSNGSLANNAVQVFPTSAHEVLSVTYNDDAAAQYQIVSLTGATLLKGALGKGTTKLDIASLAAGTYVLEVQNGTGKAARRFSKL